MHLVFFNTSDVFKAEELLLQHSITVEIVPTPVQDKAYCGVCVKIANDDMAIATELLQQTERQIVL